MKGCSSAVLLNPPPLNLYKNPAPPSHLRLPNNLHETEGKKKGGKEGEKNTGGRAQTGGEGGRKGGKGKPRSERGREQEAERDGEGGER